MTSEMVDSGDDKSAANRKLAGILGEHFRTWYQEHERVQNTRQGTASANDPSPIPPPEQHAASRLLQCHRKTIYQAQNAPGETSRPIGLFWFSKQLETELVVPFLRAYSGHDVYVRKSTWVDYAIPKSSGRLRVRGRTDPVVVDAAGHPLVLTEIKTTASVETLDEPRTRHVAQVHAYMYGLSGEAERDVHDAVLMYIDRETLDVRTFTVAFDEQFWENQVLTWAEENTEYRRREELPPARPEFDWECEYCAYRHRCGRGDSPYSDTGPRGLLPLFDGYPRNRVREFLEAREEAKLTPTLAHKFPDLVDRYGVLDWHCQRCSETYEYDAADWDGDTENPPLCETCCRDGVPAPLSGPLPEDQHSLPTECTS